MDDAYIEDADPDIISEFYVPCRTVCGNGILDIEEECEPYANLLIRDKSTYFKTCNWDVPDKGDAYEFCSEQCMCKEGWE